MAEDTKKDEHQQQQQQEEDDDDVITKGPEIISPYPNTTTTFISWESFHLPSSFPTQSPILLASASSDPTPLHTWSTPPVNPTTPIPLVFPPDNHENLNFDHQQKVKPRTKPKTVSFDSSTKTDVNFKPPVVFELNPWWVFFQFKLPAIVGNLFKFFVIKKGVFWSFGFPVLMVLLYFRRRRRRENVDELLGVIKEKDERIRCLLYQIARMNELLLATHHGVPPMISKAATSS